MRQKSKAGGAWFHVYNRGVGRAAVFRRAADRRVFLDCFARHLGPAVEFDARGRAYRNMRGEVAVAAYCLMDNHFHLIVWAESEQALRRLMHAALTAYTSYFNRRYGRPGTLWQGRFRFKQLPEPEDVMRATAYVHLNANDDPAYRWSSHAHFVSDVPPIWMDVAALLEVFGGRVPYERFIAAELTTRTRIAAIPIGETWFDLESPPKPSRSDLP